MLDFHISLLDTAMLLKFSFKSKYNTSTVMFVAQAAMGVLVKLYIARRKQALY